MNTRNTGGFFKRGAEKNLAGVLVEKGSPLNRMSLHSYATITTVMSG